MLEDALSYARRGWLIIPLHTCDGTFIGKEPLTDCGFKDATSNEMFVRYWWDKWPDANIGIKTGYQSGLVVLDIDKKNDGPESLRLCEEYYGRLPKTLTVESGGGGLHFYFRHPGFELRGRLGMRPGMDVKADGGGITAPPSLHFSGKRYVWRDGPEDTELAHMPDWLLTMIQTKSPKANPLKNKVEVAMDNIFGEEKCQVGDVEEVEFLKVLKQHPWVRVKG